MAWKFKRPESEHWWIGYRLNGKQYRRSTGSADEAEADKQIASLGLINQAQKAGKLTDEFFRLLTDRTASNDTLLDVTQLWLTECKDLSPVTLKKYRDTIREFSQTVNGATPLRDIRPETIRAFLRAKRAATSATTAKLHRKVLCAFFNFARDNEILTVSPVPSSKSLKLTGDKRSERRAFTLKELKTVYDKCPSDFWRYMVIGGFYTALRMGDLIMMPWGAVDFQANVIRLTTRKTGTAMNIPLHPVFAKIISKLRPKNLKPADPIWPEQSARYELKGAGVFSNEFYDDVLLPAGLVPKRSKHPEKDENGSPVLKLGRQTNAVSFHCLRHTFVSLVKVSGGSQAVAKELAGHSSDAVSDLYTHVPEDVLARTIKKLPSLR
jgi:integrase